MNGNAPRMDSNQLLSIAETRNASKRGSRRTIPRSRRNSSRRAKLGDKLTTSLVEPGHENEKGHDDDGNGHGHSQHGHSHGDLLDKEFQPK